MYSFIEINKWVGWYTDKVGINIIIQYVLQFV